MLKTGSEIARLKGVSKQAVNGYILKNAIQPAGAKGKYPTYDTDKEPLASYIGTAQKKPPPGQPVTRPSSAPPPKSAEAAARLISKPLNELLSGKITSGRKPSSEFYLRALKIAEKNQDAALLFKLAQIADKEDRDELYQRQMIKTEQAKERIAQEKAERLKIENEIRRDEYMDKATVKLIFGKNYAIDTSVLMPLGLKLADMIDALVDTLPRGPERRNKIQDMIDNEIFPALETKKRLLADYIEGAVGAA